MSFIYPLVALVIDNQLFGHTLSPVQVVGGVIILLAAAGNNLGWGEPTKTRDSARKLIKSKLD